MPPILPIWIMNTEDPVVVSEAPVFEPTVKPENEGITADEAAFVSLMIH